MTPHLSPATLIANADILMNALKQHGPRLSAKTTEDLQKYLNYAIDRGGFNRLTYDMNALVPDEDKAQLLSYNTWEPMPTWTAENNIPLALWHGPLLVWMCSQPWADQLHPEGFAQMWHNSFPSFGRAAALLAAVLHLSQETSAPFPLARYEMLFDTCAKVQSWEGLSGEEDHVRRAYVQRMGAAAVACGPEYKNKWLALLDNTTGDSCGTTIPILVDILDSALPNDFKLDAARRSLNTHWLKTEVMDRLKNVLPQDESERYAMIPWLDARNKPSRAGFMGVYTARSNEYLMQHYCPRRHALLASLATTDNWGDPAWLVAMGSMESNPVESLALPQEFNEVNP